MVGERGFEPPSPRSRTIKVKNPSALSGVAYEPAHHSFCPSVVPKLYRTLIAPRRRRRHRSVVTRKCLECLAKTGRNVPINAKLKILFPLMQRARERTASLTEALRCSTPWCDADGFNSEYLLRRFANSTPTRTFFVFHTWTTNDSRSVGKSCSHRDRFPGRRSADNVQVIQKTGSNQNSSMVAP